MAKSALCTRIRFCFTYSENTFSDPYFPLHFAYRAAGSDRRNSGRRGKWYWFRKPELWPWAADRLSDIYSNLESSTKESVFWIVADVLRGRENISMKNCVGCLTDGISNMKGQFNGCAFRLKIIIKGWPSQALWVIFWKLLGCNYRRSHVTSWIYKLALCTSFILFMHLLIDLDHPSQSTKDLQLVVWLWRLWYINYVNGQIVHASFYLYPWVVSTHIDSGHGPMTSCSQRNSSKPDTSTTWKSIGRMLSHPVKAILDQPASGWISGTTDPNWEWPILTSISRLLCKATGFGVVCYPAINNWYRDLH